LWYLKFSPQIDFCSKLNKARSLFCISEGKKFWQKLNLEDLAVFAKNGGISFPPKLFFSRHPSN